MAKYVKNVHGNFDNILEKLDNAILSGSVSASYEDGSDYQKGDFRCAVRVYERYSYIGSNRVSMTLTLVGENHQYKLIIITSGGSQGILFKVNTWGEEAFLKKLDDILEEL